MASFRIPIRLWPTLMAAVVLSALSAAEATLAAAPLRDATQRGDRGDWPAQLTPVKDRDSANPRTIRPAESHDDRLAPPTHAGGVARFTYSPVPLRLAAAGVLPVLVDHVIVTAMLAPHTLGLPPPIC